ncbi:GcrA family cell cycle regulator [Acetobacter oeni]|uniref:GcrA family cell cycle regulator n=1 Tax=Acetobacter oeni TaxID=304077 RepID=UPI0011BFBCE4|nr:GcrA family cell cycle regulator [Acetobacter oeni]MBB3883010.1 GcrA cell cycle regulator [Acetobacter oeni]NHO19086.1 GcrA cell cycle regulator [Acetobacter oeni]
MEWTDETIARLKALWQEGLSTAEIGRQIGITKNAVVGKAHRLGLPARPSPIRRQGATAKAATAKPASVASESEVRPAIQQTVKITEPVKAVAESSTSQHEVTKAGTPAVIAAPEAGHVRPAKAASVQTTSENQITASAPVVVSGSGGNDVVVKTASENEKSLPPASSKSTTADASPAVVKTPPATPKPAASRSAFRSISSALEPRRRGPSCCWPLGDPGMPDFHFCGATPLPGKPYCAEHAALAYVKLRDRRESVA